METIVGLSRGITDKGGIEDKKIPLSSVNGKRLPTDYPLIPSTRGMKGTSDGAVHCITPIVDLLEVRFNFSIILK